MSGLIRLPNMYNSLVKMPWRITWSLIKKPIGCVIPVSYSRFTFISFFEEKYFFLQYFLPIGKQKNWVPFEYNNTLHFIQQFNPLHVVTIDHVDVHGAATMKTASRYPLIAGLPWNTTKYGDHIRGGSQAILLPSGDKYLAFFHTSVENPPSFLIQTYFMGALLFNGTLPFNLLAMSEVPILKPQIYSGPWARDGLDYVVFPTGAFMDEPDSSESENHDTRRHLQGDKKHQEGDQATLEGDYSDRFVWVSAGYQDRHGLMMKMNLQGLLDSLSPINQTPIAEEDYEEYLGSFDMNGGGGGGGGRRRKITKADERRVAEVTVPHNL